MWVTQTCKKWFNNPIYGSSRVGIDSRQGVAGNTELELIGYNAPTDGITTHILGLKQYELVNHLGNVLTTISDKKAPIDVDDDGTIDYYVADITSATDYYPFGSPMDGRNFSSDKYRFGFNGKENDNEIQGGGNSYDFGARIYDSRLGRWLSLDPLMKKYPTLSPFNFCANNPIIYIDPDGEDVVFFNNKGEEIYRVKTSKVNATYVYNLNTKAHLDISKYTNDQIVNAAQSKKSGCGWVFAEMPKVIQNRTQSKEDVSGQEYQVNDYVIAARTNLFNQSKNNGSIQLYTDGGDEIPKSTNNQIPDLDPTLVKAIAIQEKHNGVTGFTDILSANNKGDFGKLKSKLGLTEDGPELSVSNSLYYGIRILASKGFKGGVTYDKKTGDKTYTFQGWDEATKSFNGGGNEKYLDSVKKMVSDAK